MKPLLRMTAWLSLAVIGYALPQLAGIGFSGATFTGASSSSATVSAAPDWTPPTVFVVDPGSAVSGTVSVTAQASDNIAVQSVRLQFSVSGSGTWADLCTASTEPWTCTWNTGSVADDAYELRAIATDTSGYTTTSAVVGTDVVNHLRVVLADPGENLRGTVSLSARVYQAPSTPTLKIEYAKTGTGNWITACGLQTTGALTCSWTTPATGSYDLRAVATIATTTYMDSITQVTVDNTAPTVSVISPAGTLSGVVTVGATAADADSGVASVTLRYAPAGTTSWTPLCTAASAPWSCRWDTTKLAGGRYEVQAVAVDVAGNTATSSTTTVSVDNTVNSVSLENPGAYVSGAVQLSANAASTNGVASAQFQQRTSGSGAFTTICTTSTTPYTCSWNTLTTKDGRYDLQAVLTDNKGNQLTSAVVTVSVDNSPLKAFDVQATNGSTIIGRIQTGDTLQLTYSTTVQPATIAAGWGGGSRAVTVSLTDNGSNDTLTFAGANLGTVALGQNYVKKNKTITFASTMVATQVTSGGVTRSVITIVLGAQTGGGTVTAPAAGTMTWTPLSSVLSSAGLPCSTTPATESGTTNKDF